MQYCLVSSPRWRQTAFPNGLPDPLPSGLYQWLSAFEDHELMVPRTPEEVARFDIIHINIPRANVPYVGMIADIIKRENLKTKLVVNIDYAIELWQANYEHVTLMLGELDKADLIFCTEPHAAYLVGDYLDRPVPTIPHPVDVDYIASLKVPKETEGKVVGIMGHRYDTNFVLPHFLLHGLDCSSILFGYTESDSKGIGFLYTATVNRMGFTSYLDVLGSCDLVIETAITHSYGRSVVECAALGVPCVGGNNVYAMNEIFDKYVTDANDILSQKAMIRQVLRDDNYLEQFHRDRANEFFSVKACRSAMMEALGFEYPGNGRDQDVRADIREPLEEESRSHGSG